MSSVKVIMVAMILPYLVTPEDKFAYNYDSDTFKKQIDLLDGNFIMFYAPWCSHCTDFHPIWQELAELINTPDSNFAIAQVDCTIHKKLCSDNDITGYPTLLYFHKKSTDPVEYKGTRDMPSLTLFLSEVFTLKHESPPAEKQAVNDDVVIYGSMAYLNDQNVEKYLSKGQHFVMFYAPWCKASQKLAPVWAELALHYRGNSYIQIGKLNCMDNPVTCENFAIKQYPYLLWIVNGRVMGVTESHELDQLKNYVEKMLLAENHDPKKFMTKKKVLPVARITEETFETFLDKEIVFVNFFAPWCAHCMQLSPLWLKLGERFQNESRVLIADVDCARSKPICDLEKVSGLPTLVLYRDKKIVLVEHGSKPLDSLVAIINDQLKQVNENNNDQLTQAIENSNEQLTQAIENNNEQLTQAIENNNEQLKQVSENNNVEAPKPPDTSEDSNSPQAKDEL